MGVKVLSRVRQLFTHSLSGLSLAQDSMLLRLRRASLALLGLIGAVGLGLVIFISQLGWTGALTNPLPDGPVKVGAIHDAIALKREGQRGSAPNDRQSGVAARGAARNAKRRAAGGSGETRGANSPKLASVSPAAPGQSADSPPSPSSPTSEPAPVVSTPAPSSPTTASVGSGPTTTGASKASNDSTRAVGLTGAKTQGPQSAASKDPVPTASKSAELASSKANRDESSATPAAAAAPPAASSPAAAKEAGDAAKASQGHH